MYENLTYMATHLLTHYHDGQLDKTGQPYILHPQRVALKLWRDAEERGAPFPEELYVTGLLHDLFEDTYACRAIIMGYVPESVIDAIEIVSRKEGETYMEFIHRIANSENRMAILVKLADLSDNLDPVRTARLRAQDPDKAAGLERRYLKAQAFLQARLAEMDKEAKESHLYGDVK